MTASAPPTTTTTTSADRIARWLLIAIGIYSRARRNRFEDAAILMLAGGAVSALFVGDFVFFVATAALAGLAAAWTVFASPLPGADRAGVRLLIWHGLEGLLFLAGVALHITAQSGSVELVRLDVDTISGGCIFAALMIRVGAPTAHVWFKDVVSHASPAGGAALSSFTTMLGIYALVTVGLGVLVGGGSSWVVAVATLVVALAFRPLRARIQDLVDRRYRRARYEGVRLVRSFEDEVRDGRRAPEEIGAVLALVDGIDQHTVLDAPTVVAFWISQLPTRSILAVEERTKVRSADGQGD